MFVEKLALSFARKIHYCKNCLLVSNQVGEHPISLNVSFLIAVDKSPNKHKVINFRTADFAAGRRRFAADFYSEKVMSH